MNARVIVGHLPVGWRTWSLGDVVSRVTRRNYSKNTNVLTISARDGLISQEDYFLKRVASSDLSPYFVLTRGDFAYNKSYSNGYPVGVIRRLDRYPNGVVSPLYICFRPNPQLVDSDYLVHYFESGLLDDSISWIAKEGARNHGLLNVGVRDLLSISIQVPPLTEQKHIAEILSAADDTIQSAEELIAKLKGLRQGLIRDLFTQGVDESGHLRNTKVHEEFKDSSLGRIPKLWTVKKLADIGTVRSGATPPRSMEFRYFTPDGLPWVKTLDLNEGPIFRTDERISKAAVLECSCPVLPKGTVLVAMYGGWAQIGRTGLLATPGTINQAISSIEIFDDSVLPEYLLIALQYHRNRWKMVGASTRKDPNITRQDVLDFEVPVPSPTEQELIINLYSTSTARLSSEQKDLSKLRIFKQGLMDDLLTGRVRVGVSG